MDTEKHPGLFARQSTIVKPNELPKHIVIVGAGGIGSWTVLCLAKLGCQRITVVDNDIVEDVNLAPQVYGMRDIGQSKAETIAAFVNSNMDQEIVTPVNSLWQEWTDREEYFDDEMVDVFIMAVDTMDVRIKMWNEVKSWGLDLVIDSRMTKEVLEVLAVRPGEEKDIETYKSRLFPSSDVEHVPCTERAVAYNQFVVAGVIGSQVKHFAKGELIYNRIMFDLVSYMPIIK